MKLPFTEQRPLVPFAQSEAFNRQLLGGNQNQQTLNEDEVLTVEMDTESPDEALRFLDDSLVHMGEFATFTEAGHATGEKETDVGRRTQVAIMYLAVDRVKDSDVTVGQVEEFIRGEMMGGPVNVFDVQVYK